MPVYLGAIDASIAKGGGKFGARDRAGPLGAQVGGSQVQAPHLLANVFSVFDQTQFLGARVEDVQRLIEHIDLGAIDVVPDSTLPDPGSLQRVGDGAAVDRGVRWRYVCHSLQGMVGLRFLGPGRRFRIRLVELDQGPLRVSNRDGRAAQRQTVEVRAAKVLRSISEVDDIEDELALLFKQPGTAPNDLLELWHRANDAEK